MGLKERYASRAMPTNLGAYGPFPLSVSTRSYDDTGDSDVTGATFLSMPVPVPWRYYRIRALQLMVHGARANASISTGVDALPGIVQLSNGAFSNTSLSISSGSLTIKSHWDTTSYGWLSYFCHEDPGKSFHLIDDNTKSYTDNYQLSTPNDNIFATKAAADVPDLDATQCGWPTIGVRNMSATVNESFEFTVTAYIMPLSDEL